MRAPRMFDLFKRASSTHQKLLLGRWNIHTHGETSLKIKYANEDNCGISGNNCTEVTQKSKQSDFDNNQYLYSMGYESVHN